MTKLEPKELLFYLDENGGSLVDHQLPGKLKQRTAMLRAAQEDENFKVIPGHATLCGCAVVSLSELGQKRVEEVLREANDVKDIILQAFERESEHEMPLWAIMRAIRTQTPYGARHIGRILDSMGEEGKMLTREKSGEKQYVLPDEE